MTSRTDFLREDHPASGKTIALTLLSGFVALVGFTGFMGALKPEPALWSPLRLCIAAAGMLLSAGALWRLSRLAPSRVKSVTLLLVLGTAAFAGLGGAFEVVSDCIATPSQSGAWTWQTAAALARNLTLLLVGVVGFLRFRPWIACTDNGEPVSPKTRRTQKLYLLSGLVAIPGMLALIHGGRSASGKVGLFSNSPVSPGIALFAIASWLLGMALSWWWYVSADEHERHSYDFGTLIGGGMFLTVTPAWWVASRAELVPPPDAMILWVITMLVTTVAWAWRR
jgi:hypothetical protein